MQVQGAQVLGVRCQVYRFQVSGAVLQVSSMHVLDVKCHVPGVSCSGSRCQLSRFQVSGARFQLSGAKYQRLGSQGPGVRFANITTC